MAEFFGGKGGAVSITDSTMMRIVHDAMNRAHERVKSKEGAIERLNGISKFYELAVMQLEGCTRFVQEESSDEEEVLAGLSEMRSRLIGRLRESESAMGEKDRELAARAESEANLRRGLAGKEREVASLKARLERSRTTMVEQQQMRQRLEPDCNGDERRVEGAVGDEKVEEMGSDIDALKETLDVAFGRMRNAVFLSELAPLEQHWQWAVEKDTLCLLVSGLVADFREILHGRSPRLWPGLVDEVAGLKSELGSLFAEAPGRSADPITVEVEEDEHYVAKMIKNHESIIRKKAEKLLSSSCRGEKELDSIKNRAQRVIAKLDRLVDWNRKLFGSSETLEDAWKSTAKPSFGAEKQVAEKIRKLEKELQDMDLENKIRDEIYVTLFRGLSEELRRCEDFAVEMKEQWNENVQANNFESQIREEILCVVFGDIIKDFGSELTESRKASSEDNYSSDVEFCYILDDVEIQATIRDQIETLIFGQMLKDWNGCIEAYESDVLVREDMCLIIFDETVKSIVHNATSALRRCDVKLVEDLLKNDVWSVFINETVKEWTMKVDEHTKQTLVGQEIYQFVVLEAAKDAIARFKDSDTTQLQKCKQLDAPESLKRNLQKYTEEGPEIKGRNEAELLKCEVFGEKRRSSSLSIKLQKTTISFSKENEEKLLDRSDSVVTPLLGFFQAMVDFEHAATQKLETNNLRLEEIKQHLKPIAERASSLREKESLYLRAFIRRCQNLHKAETEVDLLGDQVEGLLGLLHKVHVTLQNRSPNLRQNYWVLELLKLIEKESNGVIRTTKH